MDVGFSLASESSFVEIRVYGERDERLSALTHFAQEANCCAALMGRLYYRDKLLAIVSSDRDREATTNDAALALAAYNKWGADGIRRLEGDYCLVIWDAKSSRLYAARDPMGGFPLFWTNKNGRFAASTSINTLVASESNPLNLDYIAEYLSLPALAIQELPSEICVYEGIQRVMPGAIIEVDIRARTVRPYSSWNWLDHLSDPGTDRMEAIADQFGDLFRNAVRERIRGNTAAHLSGGMDSTAVALVARDCLKSEIGEQPLSALSLVYERLTTLQRETRYIESALEGQCNIASHRIIADDLLTYDGALQGPPPDEPFAGLIDAVKDMAMVEKAAAIGVRTILTGQGADDVFDILPFHITDMLGNGWISTAWRESGDWAKALNTSSWEMFSSFGLTPLLPAPLQAGWRSFFCNGRVAWERQKPGTIAPWVLPDFSKSYRLYERGLFHLHKLYRDLRPVGLCVALASARGLAGDGRRWALTTPRGIMLAHPFTDPRILSLSLGTRLRLQPEPGKHKPLLSYAMRNVLPDTIRNRRGKNNFNEVYYRGVARNRPTLESLVRQSRLCELGIINPDVLIRCLRQTALGGDHARSGTMRLDSTLSLVIWLAMQDSVRRAEKSNSRVIRFPLNMISAGLELRPC